MLVWKCHSGTRCYGQLLYVHKRWMQQENNEIKINVITLYESSQTFLIYKHVFWASLSSVNNLVSFFEERRRQERIWGGRKVEREERSGESLKV